MKTLQEIEQDVARRAQAIGAATRDLPTYGYTRDGAYPHIEVDGRQYHYVVVERGIEQERRSTGDYEELLYWIFSDVTHSLAFAYELRHRIEGQDSRRLAFSKQIEILNLLDPAMARRRTGEIAAILQRAPYAD